MPQLDLRVGSFSFHLYGLFVSLGIIFWYFYLKISLKRTNEYVYLNSIISITLISALVGARLYHVLSWYSYYQRFPIEIFYFWQGGLGIFGAIIGGLIGIFIFSKIKHISLMCILNLITPPLLMTQAIGRLGNYFNYEAFGPPTDLPWKIFIPISERPINYLGKSYFHPTFLYESVLCLTAFGIFFILSKKIKIVDYGLAYYFIAYGFIRFFSEFWRFDTWVIYNIRIGHLLSLIMISSGIWLWYTLIKYKKSTVTIVTYDTESI